MRRSPAVVLTALLLAGCGGHSAKNGAVQSPTPAPSTPATSSSASATTAGTPSPSGAAPATSSAPTFVGVRDGRVAEFELPGGRLRGYLTPAQPGGGASEPVRAGDGSLWWVQGSGTCSASIQVLRGGKRSTFYADGVSYGLAVSRDGKEVAWLHQHDCSGGVPELRVAKPGTAFAKAWQMPNPPVVVGAPSWAPDGRHLAYFLRTGNQGAVHVIDVTRDARIEQGSSSSAPDCRWFQPRYTADGTLVVLSCTGGGNGTSAAPLDVARGTLGPALFTLPVPNDQVSSFSLAADGRAALTEAGDTVRWWHGGTPTTVACGCHYPSL